MIIIIAVFTVIAVIGSAVSAMGSYTRTLMTVGGQFTSGVTAVTLGGELPCDSTGYPATAENQNLTLRSGTGWRINLHELTAVQCSTNGPTQDDGGSLTASMSGTCMTDAVTGPWRRTTGYTVEATLRFVDGAATREDEKSSDFVSVTLSGADQSPTACNGELTGPITRGELKIHGEVTGFTGSPD